MAHDQDAVAAHHQIGLDNVGPLPDGEVIGCAGVFRAFAGGPAVGDDQGMGQRGARGEEDEREQDEPDHAPGRGAGDDGGMTVHIPLSSFRAERSGDPEPSGAREREPAGSAARQVAFGAAGFRPSPE